VSFLITRRLALPAAVAAAMPFKTIYALPAKATASRGERNTVRHQLKRGGD
jgi:hypothetical protein